MGTNVGGVIARVDVSVGRSVYVGAGVELGSSVSVGTGVQLGGRVPTAKGVSLGPPGVSDGVSDGPAVWLGVSVGSGNGVSVGCAVNCPPSSSTPPPTTRVIRIRAMMTVEASPQFDRDTGSGGGGVWIGCGWRLAEPVSRLRARRALSLFGLIASTRRK